MKTIELFCGTKSFSKVADRFGYSTYTVDNDDRFNPNLLASIMDINMRHPCFNHVDGADILWASPPCTTFSVASISTHWKGGKGAYIPKTEECKLGLRLLDRTIELIAKTRPKYWFI